MLSDARAVLEHLCIERGEDFAGLSRMLGRNPAYIQQFVRRGVPKRLKEAERRARGGGAARIELSSGSQRTEAHAFYRACGYSDGTVRFVKRLGAA